jgi:hypothetical protein
VIKHSSSSAPGRRRNSCRSNPNSKPELFFWFNSALLIAVIFVFVLLSQVTTDEGKKRGSIHTAKAELTMAARKSQSTTQRDAPRVTETICLSSGNLPPSYSLLPHFQGANQKKYI